MIGVWLFSENATEIEKSEAIAWFTLKIGSVVIEKILILEKPKD